ncbi:MAG: hypothetical protein ACXACX_09435, partial [Candidatus Hodarchaeales archaeon]
QLELLRQALEGFLKNFSKEPTLLDMVYDLNNQYDVLEETLATVVNWLSLHKSIIRGMGMIEKLTNPSVLLQPEDEVKKTIRTLLLPQSGSMVRDVVAGLRGSTKIIELIGKDLGDLNNKIKVLKNLDEKFLEIIEYESTISDGLLSEVLNNIYSGFYDSSADKLFKLLNNVKEFTEEKRGE